MLFSLSRLYSNYKSSQFEPSRFCSLFQIAMKMNRLLYNDLPENTLAERFKKAKLISGLTQYQLSDLIGLSRSTINELECGYRDYITRETLLKLISVLDKDIICDDYLLYILNQEKNITFLIDQYGIIKLCTILKCHHSSIYRWKDFKFQLPKDKFEIIKKLDQD